MMTLGQGHRADLEASGLTEETIARAGIYSAPERQVRDLLGYGAGAGMVFPYPPLNGTGPYARVKLDQADENGKRYRSPLKQASRLYIPPLLDRQILTDATTALWVTEGEKKTLKALQEGLPCIGVSGVWNWKTRTVENRSVAIPDLGHVQWQGRTVYIVFDSDIEQNASVKLAEHGLCRELNRRGAKVMAIRLPAGPGGAKVGLDDYLLTHSVESLCAIEPRPIRNPAIRPGPEAVDATELLRRTYPEPPAIVSGGVIVRGSLNVLAAPPKRGKSMLTMNLAVRRALDQPWLGFQTSPGRTLLLNAEVQEREVQTRLRIMLHGLGDAALPDKRVIFVTYRGLRLDRADGLQACRKLVEQVRPDLLVLDPMARFYGGDENSAREIGRLIGSLDDLVQAYGVAVLLVHHTSKPSAQDPREGGQRLRGSSALFAAVDSMLLLDRDDDAFKLTFELRNGREPEPMRLTRSDSLWFAPAGPPENLLAAARIVQHIALTHKGLVGALKSDLEVSRATAERMVSKALRAGLLAKTEDGLYTAALTHPQEPSEGEVSAHG